MKPSLLAAVLLIVGAAGQALAASSPSVCAARKPTDTDATFVARTFDYCEVHWKGIVSPKLNGGQPYNAAVDACARRCAGKLAPKYSAYDLNTIAIAAVPGLIAVGAGAATVASQSAPPPAPPPASP